MFGSEMNSKIDFETLQIKLSQIKCKLGNQRNREFQLLLIAFEAFL